MDNFGSNCLEIGYRYVNNRFHDIIIIDRKASDAKFQEISFDW